MSGRRLDAAGNVAGRGALFFDCHCNARGGHRQLLDGARYRGDFIDRFLGGVLNGGDLLRYFLGGARGLIGECLHF